MSIVRSHLILSSLNKWFTSLESISGFGLFHPLMVPSAHFCLIIN